MPGLDIPQQVAAARRAVVLLAQFGDPEVVAIATSLDLWVLQRPDEPMSFAEPDAKSRLRAHSSKWLEQARITCRRHLAACHLAGPLWLTSINELRQKD